jgi:hypothetical protein
MGLKYTTVEHVVALYDSVTDWAFGPIFYSEDAATRFLDWAEAQGVKDGDVRQLSNEELDDLWGRYVAQGGTA